MDTLVNIYPTLIVCCVALSGLSAVIACVVGLCLFRPDTRPESESESESESERDIEIDKQIADLQTALRLRNRNNRRMSQKCQRLERRVKQLEKINKRVK